MPLQVTEDLEASRAGSAVLLAEMRRECGPTAAQIQVICAAEASRAMIG